MCNEIIQGVAYDNLDDFQNVSNFIFFTKFSFHYFMWWKALEVSKQSSWQF